MGHRPVGKAITAPVESYPGGTPTVCCSFGGNGERENQQRSKLWEGASEHGGGKLKDLLLERLLPSILTCACQFSEVPSTSWRFMTRGEEKARSSFQLRAGCGMRGKGLWHAAQPGGSKSQRPPSGQGDAPSPRLLNGALGAETSGLEGPGVSPWPPNCSRCLRVPRETPRYVPALESRSQNCNQHMAFPSVPNFHFCFTLFEQVARIQFTHQIAQGSL